ncbi:maleylpyruvate isomerase family mycothiol-dependent enzyme [Brachybacterium hainanense]|uniref:Maleylpyruvate isomerase family mycothiol-dependent enzyme n=1 Tax=Brachybacterium hainanense TaxID=1541174 RepID=A0ABV6RCY8_9MICO
MTDDIHARTTANRLRLADLLDSLPECAWDSPTLCAGWSVRLMAAHLIQPMLIGFGRFFLASLRHRGDTAATIDALTRRIAQRERSELVAELRTHAGDRVDPPRVGPMGPFADSCIHLRDIARPLGLDADVPTGDWLTLLEHLTSPRPVPALLPPGRLDGLSLLAVDASWSSRSRIGGRRGEISGPAEALAMAVTGRRAALEDLSGPGVPTLEGRIPGA